MKRVIKACDINLDDENLKINATKQYGCFVEILASIKKQLDAMLSHHSRVIVIRVDLHVNNYTPNNELLSKFMRKLRKRLVNKYGVKRMGFVWVREMEKAKRQHYHLAICLDANKVNYPEKTYALIEEIWVGWGQPKPFRPEHGYYIIKRGVKEAYQAAFERLSYMAKERGKGYKADKANDYSASQIKEKISLNLDGHGLENCCRKSLKTAPKDVGVQAI